MIPQKEVVLIPAWLSNLCEVCLLAPTVPSPDGVDVVPGGLYAYPVMREGKLLCYVPACLGCLRRAGYVPQNVPRGGPR